MYNDKTLYRSCDSLVGGVCEGIAEYFNIDPILVRIVMVVGTLATGGLLGVFYVAMWVILPKRPSEPTPVEVRPESVHSETRGAIKYSSTFSSFSADAPYRPADGQRVPSSSSGFLDNGPAVPMGIGHTPPVPPQTYNSFLQTPVSHESSRYAGWSQEGSARSASVEGCAGAASSPGRATVDPGFSQGMPGVSSVSVSPAPSAPESSVGAMLWLGLFLLFCGVAALLGNFVEGVSWWRFWPVLFVLIGIAQMVLPGKKESRTRQFTRGLISFSFGVVALCLSLGLVSFGSIGAAFDALWPLLMIMMGLSVLSVALKNPSFTLLGGIVFFAFCALGLVFFSSPGGTEFIIIDFPFVSYALSNPWM